MILDIYQPRKLKRALFLFPCPKYPPDPKNFEFLGAVTAAIVKQGTGSAQFVNDALRNIGCLDLDEDRDKAAISHIMLNLEP